MWEAPLRGHVAPLARRSRIDCISQKPLVGLGSTPEAHSIGSCELDGPCQRLQGPSANHLNRRVARSGMPGTREIVAVGRHSAAGRPMGGVEAAPTSATGGCVAISRRPPTSAGASATAALRHPPRRVVVGAARTDGVAATRSVVGVRRGLCTARAVGVCRRPPRLPWPCGVRRRCYLRGSRAALRT